MKNDVIGSKKDILKMIKSHFNDKYIDEISLVRNEIILLIFLLNKDMKEELSDYTHTIIFYEQ